MPAFPSCLLILLLMLTACQGPVRQAPDPFGPIREISPAFSLLITNALIVDGSGQTAYPADLLVRSDTIAFIGQVDTSGLQISTTIDAKGRVLSPGFIDPHSHGDPQREQDFANFLFQGVTSITLGQDGFSPRIDDWEAWMRRIEAKGIAPNLAVMIGHGSMRERSGAGFEEQPAPEAFLKMQKMLVEALQAGAFGMSTGLEYTPGLYAGEKELQALAKTVGQFDAMIMSHIRNEDDDQLFRSLDELIRQGEHCRVQVSHIKSVYGKGSQRGREIRQKLDSARQTGIDIRADIYPYPASYTTIGIVFPDWARPPNHFPSVRQLKRAQLRQFLVERISKRNGPEATLFGTAPYAGKSLARLEAEQQKDFADILIDEIGPQGASAAYFVMDSVLMDELIQDRLMMISSDGSPGMRHPRGHGTFAKIIQDYVVRRQLLSLETAIHKMSGLTAESMKIHKRGFIRQGYFADLILFRPRAVKARATFTEPYRLAEGMDLVVVNGQVVMQAGQLSGLRPGVVLRRRH